MSALMRDEDRHTGADLKAMVRGYWPDASDETVHFILWERTSFPLGPTVKHYREQMEDLKRVEESGATPCTLCGDAVPEALEHLKHPECWDCHLALAVRPA